MSQRLNWLSGVVFLVAGSLGCTGTSDLIGGRPNTGTETPPTTETGNNPPVEEDTSAAFKIPRDQLHLLPFRVRLSKVAAVMGVPTTDPALNDLRTNRLELGDYDYANGVTADSSWTSSKVTLWVRSLRSVCNAPAMKQQYPDLPANLDKLILAAYGRAALPSDGAQIEEALAGATLDDAGRYLSICLAVLSSAEFVSR